MQRGSIVGLHQFDQPCLERRYIYEALPGEIVFEIPPYPFDRVQFRRVGFLKEQDNVLRNVEIVGGMAATVIAQQHIERLRISLGKLVQEDLKQRARQLGQAEKVAIAAVRCDRPIQIAVGKAVLVGSDRLCATSSNAPPTNGLQAKAALVKRP